MKEETAAPAKLCPSGPITRTERAALKDYPPGVGLEHVGEALQEHGLARAARTKKRENASARHLDADSRKDNVVVKALVEVFHLKEQILDDDAHGHTRNEVIT